MLENLEYVTVKKNVIHALMLGLRKTRISEECNFTKLSRKTVMKIRKEYKRKKITQQYLADKYNTSRPNISTILNKKTWT